MQVPIDTTIVRDFCTHTTAGAVSDADSTPTIEVFEDDTDVAILTPTATKRTSKTGNYRVSLVCTTANGFEVGKSYNVIASATVGGTTAKAVLASFEVVKENIDFLIKIIRNKRKLVEVAGVTYLVVYDDDGVTEILNKATKDKDGNDIISLLAGVLAQELASSV